MPKQPVLPGLRDALKKRATRRKQIMAKMDAVEPCGRRLALIAPLQRHGLTEAIFPAVNAHLEDKDITLRSVTLVDATIVDAPS